MHFVKKEPKQKREDLAAKLKTGNLLRFPGAYNALVAKLIEEIGYDGVYVSGGVMANDLGMPDIGLTTLHDVSTKSHQIARVTNLPTIIDIDTGFGEAMNVSRTIETIEGLGISGCHIEDQMNPKRCGHLDNKDLVSTEEMIKKIKSAVKARKDNNFQIIARTDANAVEGLEKTIARAQAYVDAGADVVFPEALKDEKEFEEFRKNIKVYLLSNMTEFGKSKLLTKEQLENLGYNIVIYPVTTQRLALKNVEDGLKKIFEEGHQNNVIDKMQTRKRLYELVEYEKYGEFDQSIFNFGTKGHE
jgi:methylisocitrate lyase